MYLAIVTLMLVKNKATLLFTKIHSWVSTSFYISAMSCKQFRLATYVYFEHCSWWPCHIYVPLNAAIITKIWFCVSLLYSAGLKLACSREAQYTSTVQRWWALPYNKGYVGTCGFFTTHACRFLVCACMYCVSFQVGACCYNYIIYIRRLLNFLAETMMVMW